MHRATAEDRGTGRTHRMLEQAVRRASGTDAKVLVVVGSDDQRPQVRLRIVTIAGRVMSNVIVASLDDVDSGRMRGLELAATFEDHTVAEEQTRRLAAFREGDIVRLERDDSERTVTAVDENLGVNLAIGVSDSWHKERMTLLRRPVRVGDVLDHPNHKGNWAGLTPPLTEEMASASWAPTWEGWTHEDGTAIEPPAVVASGTLVHPELEMWAGTTGLAAKPLDVARLARLLFETDPGVIAHVTLRSENDVSQRRAAVMQRCFDRGSSGESPEWKWFVRASDRAEAMTARIRGGT